MAAPAVGIRVIEPARLADQRPARPQELYDRLVRLEDLLAAILRQAFHELAAFADWVVDFEVVANTSLKVLAAMSGRVVHGAGAIFGSDVICDHPAHFPI